MNLESITVAYFDSDGVLCYRNTVRTVEHDSYVIHTIFNDRQRTNWYMQILDYRKLQYRLQMENLLTLN
jgi:hypothetical protein